MGLGRASPSHSICACSPGTLALGHRPLGSTPYNDREKDMQQLGGRSNKKGLNKLISADSSFEEGILERRRQHTRVEGSGPPRDSSNEKGSRGVALGVHTARPTAVDRSVAAGARNWNIS